MFLTLEDPWDGNPREDPWENSFSFTSKQIYSIHEKRVRNKILAYLAKTKCATKEHLFSKMKCDEETFRSVTEKLQRERFVYVPKANLFCAPCYKRMKIESYVY